MFAMPALPEGVITLFFSDVEGSTRLAKSHGDAAWAELLETHRRLLRQAFAAHGGLEVDTQGDSFFAVFRMASDAVAAALAAQHSLAAQAWPAAGAVRVRIGLHTGEAIARGDHYVGQEIHRASRICDAGHGGQIVVSQTTAELVRGSLPDGATLAPLGDYRLKDLGHAQRLFQLSAAGLASEFPRLRSLDIPTNLPTERSSFIGREADISAIRERLAGHRLVTLTGIGGSGKTRLALQVGALELGNFADGVFFVDLAPVSDAGLVSATMAGACGLLLGEGPGLSGVSLDDRLVAALARRKSLLIVDNCEHLVEAVADLLDRILAECADVGLLATSREALGVEGEQIVPVPSLALPDDAALSPAQAETHDAVRLFVERSRSVKPGFTLSAENRAAVVDVCRRLDGIPLAIEFAAARVAHLSVQQIAERLEDRFRLLTGGRRRNQRQQTLSAALDWSHDLLSEDERAVFRRLAVFAGGFALDAAEAVCSSGDIGKGQVLDLLGSLVAKSLVGTDEGERGDQRYRLLETVRMYASEKLAAAGEAQALRTRHSDWYLAWLDATPLERLAHDPATITALDLEIDNLRAAADWCQAGDWPDRLARLATRMYGYWWLMGAGLEGRRWLQQALDVGERLAVDERIACHTTVALISTVNLENALALEHATRAITLAAGKPSPFLVMALGNRSFGQSVPASLPGADPRLAFDARADADGAVAMARAGMAQVWRVWAECTFAMVETNLGDIDAAARWYERLAQSSRQGEATALYRANALAGLAVTQHLLGHNDAALRAAFEFEAFRTLQGSTPHWQRTTAIEITPALVAGGRQAHAFELLREAAQFVRKIGVPLAENHLLGMVAVVEHLRGNPHRAGRLLAASRHLAAATDRSIPFRTPAHWAFYRHYQPLVRAALGPDEARRARAEGQAMTLDEAMAYALEGLG